MLALLLSACLVQQRAETDAACIRCHENQVDDWKGSVHEKNAVGCVRCHGADSMDYKSRPHLFTAGFRRGTKKSNPKLCAGCHKPEFEAFEESGHAEDTRDDSGKVKGCTSCHEFHATAAADRRAILKESCSRCHKAGSAQLRRGESYIALLDPLPRDSEALKSARVAQHRASPAAFREIEKRVAASAAPAPDAYNTRDRGARSPWPAAIAGLIGVVALATWALRKRWRQAS